MEGILATKFDPWIDTRSSKYIKAYGSSRRIEKKIEFYSELKKYQKAIRVLHAMLLVLNMP